MGRKLKGKLKLKGKANLQKRVMNGISSNDGSILSCMCCGDRDMVQVSCTFALVLFSPISRDGLRVANR